MNLSYKNIVAFLWTRDYEASVKFYTEVLGLKVAFEADGWAELSVPGTRNAYLAINRWTRSSAPPVNEFITLGVKNLDEQRTWLASKGVEFKGDIVEFDQGMRMFKCYDPDANVVAFAEVQF